MFQPPVLNKSILGGGVLMLIVRNSEKQRVLHLTLLVSWIFFGVV